MAQNEYYTLLNHCQRLLSGAYLQTSQPKTVLAELEQMVSADQFSDNYGEGDLIESFESEIAALLGKEKAVFMPSGTMAQQIALRIWSERRGTKNVAFHPLCHLEIHEQKGYQMLHGLHGVLLGSPPRLITLDDLKAVAEPLAAILLELPQREIGGQLPSWEDLTAQAEWARGQGIPLHMDGARLWECGPYYQRPYAEIASLFDSVYVSFYKGLGGITGSALAGPADFIAEARIWQRRYGGNLIRMYPFVLSARQGLEKYLPKMVAYHERAVQIAALLSSFPQIEVVPNPPPTNMMHVYLRGDHDRLEQAARAIAKDEQIMLFYRLNPSAIPSYFMFELTVKDPALEFPDEEIRNYFELLFERAK